MKSRIPRKLDPANQTAMVHEMQGLALEYYEKLIFASDAMILLLLHEEFGFGEQRLKKVLKGSHKLHNELRERFLLEPDADLYDALLMHRYGIDLKEWCKELGIV